MDSIVALGLVLWGVLLGLWLASRIRERVALRLIERKER